MLLRRFVLTVVGRIRDAHGDVNERRKEHEIDDSANYQQGEI